MTETIVYKFHDKEKVGTVVSLSFDTETYQILLPADAPKPDWAKLECNKCRNCNIGEGHEYCPAALSMAHFLPHFADCFSYTVSVVEVETANRIVVSKLPLQSAVASLIGLTLATSGCPRTQFLRPMARFHLPFADQRETVFRSLGAWLLVEYIRNHTSGKPAQLSFDGLKEAYAQVSIVNATLAERLRAVVTHDAALNAIIILDTFALITPDNVDGGFEDISDIIVVEDV